jgi:protein SCO1
MVLVGLVAVWLHARGEQQQLAGPELPVLWEVPAFSLVSQDGATVTERDLLGHPWVADLVFTRCPVICPRMTARMAALGPHLPAGARRVSISVDPEHDTPDVLAAFARSHGAEGDWLFLSGEPDPIYRLAREGFRLGVSVAAEGIPGGEPEAITHSTRFVLVDADNRIRGFYDPFDEDSFRQLQRDARALGGQEPAR